MVQSWARLPECSADANNNMSHSASTLPVRIYRFAEFELNSATCELRRGDAVTVLQEKPLLLLMALLDRPQSIVSRDELRERMWNSKTVVEFDQGINAAIQKVRVALEDSAASPRLVETIAKRGYRLLVPVSVAAAVSEASAATVELPPPRGPRHWRWIGLAAAVAIAAWYLTGTITAVLRTEIRSLAVLPLQDLSPDQGHEYFADGVTEEITTNLAQTLDLRVISRTSVMRYKRTTKPVSQIARELGVEAIVEGSVARSGDRVTVTVQLIDAIHDRHLWAEKYTRRAEDILAIEAEVSQAVASQISGTLGRERRAKSVVSRVDPRVHELRLLGGYHLNRRTAADLAKAQDYFQRAIALNPSYAPSHAGLADVYALQPFYTSTRFGDSAPMAEAAARRALELDSSLAEPHATLGLLRISSRQWREAAGYFRRALELNPNYASAHHWYAYYLRFANRMDEACAEIEIARQLDPLSAAINADQGEMLNAARRYSEARESLLRASALAPEFARPHALLSVTEMATGNSSAAVSQARTALALDSRTPATMGQVGFTLAVAGDTTEAMALLSTLKEKARDDINVSMYAAMIEAGLGRKDEALGTLEQQARSPDSVVLQGIQHWYAFEAFRSEPRFQRLLSQAW
jgi:TolB-like protein/DNA-binding winged helix-turn-helix (wHTH) protein/Flp pilus assembly protein TadD